MQWSELFRYYALPVDHCICADVCEEQLIHDSEAEVEVMRLKVEKAREKMAQLKLALREKRGQTEGCITSPCCFNALHFSFMINVNVFCKGFVKVYDS